MKEVDKRIDETVLWWFSHTVEMDNNGIIKIVYMGQCMEKCSVGSLHTIKQAQVRPHPCKLVAFISYLIAPATFLLLAIQHHL